jgi:hypothetical protein
MKLLYGLCDCNAGTPRRSSWRGLGEASPQALKIDPRKPFIDIVARRSDWQNEERAAKPGGLGLAGGLDRLERQLPVLTRLGRSPTRETPPTSIRFRTDQINLAAKFPFP